MRRFRRAHRTHRGFATLEVLVTIPLCFRMVAKAEAKRSRRRAVWAEPLTPADWETVAQAVLNQDAMGLLERALRERILSLMAVSANALSRTARFETRERCRSERLG